MNISLSRIFSAVATLSISAFVLCSCVNEKYSTDEIDGTAVILKDLALPIGSLEKISVGEIIQLDENDQMITKDANGDYAFNFSGGNPFYVTFKVPSFSIPFVDGAKADDHYISINTGLGGVSAPSIDKKIALENQRIEKWKSIALKAKLTERETNELVKGLQIVAFDIKSI